MTLGGGDVANARRMGRHIIHGLRAGGGSGIVDMRNIRISNNLAAASTMFSKLQSGATTRRDVLTTAATLYAVMDMFEPPSEIRAGASRISNYAVKIPWAKRGMRLVDATHESSPDCPVFASQNASLAAATVELAGDMCSFMATTGDPKLRRARAMVHNKSQRLHTRFAS